MRADRGAALPSLLAAASLAAVLVAGGALVLSPDEPDGSRQVTADQGSDSAPSTQAGSGESPESPAASPAQDEKKKSGKKSGDKPGRGGPGKPNKKPGRDGEAQADRRADVYVEVYNNSGITGLAASTATTIRGAGWQVVGSDNWYGTIPASTVYYPERYREEASLLATDLGIERLKTAISPMRFDRLTVILTADYS